MTNTFKSFTKLKTLSLLTGQHSTGQLQSTSGV